MSDNPGLSDQYRRSSPWPLFVAVGLAISELGIVFPSLPLAVGGLVLFVGSVAGILTESGYVSRPLHVIGPFGGILLIVGLGLFLMTSGSIARRGQALILAGICSFIVYAIGIGLTYQSR